MKPKKNPKADLNLNSGLYFVIGLALVLFITWRALEFKSYDTQQQKIIIAHMEEPEIKEEVPVTDNIKLPPPVAPPVAPVIIEVVEDTKEIEETVIQSTESDQEATVDAAIISIDEVVVEEVEEEVTVPFAVIEDVPVFPGCEEGSREEREPVFSKKFRSMSENISVIHKLR